VYFNMASLDNMTRGFFPRTSYIYTHRLAHLYYELLYDYMLYTDTYYTIMTHKLSRNSTVFVSGW
jgi:hypothetical protein